MTAAIAAILVVPACGGSSSDANDGGPNVAAAQADVTALCDVICENNLRCDSPDPADGPCKPECLSENPEPSLFRRDVLRGLLECQSQLTCDDNDDLCAGQVVQVLVPDFMSSPLLDKCVEVQDECGGFSDDSCVYAVVFTDAGKARLETCLNEPCELVAGCMAGLRQGT